LLFAAALLAILASSEGYLLAAATAPTHPRHEAQRVHAEPGDLLLDPALARPYFQTFVQQERSFLGQPVAPLDWAWFASNIPWLDLPDQELERTYYFRWYAFRKHLHETPDGAMIDEFLDPVPWAGRDNSISAAASMHLREARWLRTAAFAQQSARFWFLPGSDPRRYSFPVAASVLDVSFAQGDPDFAISLLPDLVRNYQAWEDTHQDANGRHGRQHRGKRVPRYHQQLPVWRCKRPCNDRRHGRAGRACSAVFRKGAKPAHPDRDVPVGSRGWLLRDRPPGFRQP
jgi:hypothetical protein